jgi:hypothetical protein
VRCGYVAVVMELVEVGVVALMVDPLDSGPRGGDKAKAKVHR